MKFNFKKFTPIFTIVSIAVSIVVILGYDIVAIMDEGREASISHWIIVKSYEMPFAVFLTGLMLGIFIGHLFWRMRDTKATGKLKG